MCTVRGRATEGPKEIVSAYSSAREFPIRLNDTEDKVGRFRTGNCLLLQFLFFDFQFSLMFADKPTNVIRHIEQLGPLFFVQRYREATKPIDGHTSLFTDSKRHAFGAPRF